MAPTLSRLPPEKIAVVRKAIRLLVEYLNDPSSLVSELAFWTLTGSNI